MKKFMTRHVCLALILTLGVFLIAGCGDDDGCFVYFPTPAIPVASSTVPANGATGVPIGNKVTATFNEAMDPATITTTTFTVKQGATAVAGTVTYSGVTAVFTPTNNLTPSTTYTATITTGAKNLAGTAMAHDYVWSFTTGAAPDTTKPTVTLTVPASAATGVLLNTKVTATFSEAMDPLTLTATTFTLKQGATAVAGTVTYSGVSAVFTPASALAANTVYTATITTGAKDLAGNALASNHVWSFTTGAAPDTTSPTVTLPYPAPSATGVCTNNTVSATFSEAMDPLTITIANFSVSGVPGAVTYNAQSRIATFTPASDFAASTTYTATITTGVKDLAGNALAANKVWTFTTGTTASCTEPVPLGAIAPYGSMSGGSSGLTNQGTLTIINGDIGTTGASTTVTGFHDSTGDVYTETPLNKGTVNGRIYTAPPPPGGAGVGGTAATLAVATAAAADALTAYNNMAALPGGIDVSTLGGGAGELGNRTLAPGVYKSAPGTYGITLGDLTLDAGGNPNAVWVFQMATSLTVGIAGPTGARSVILINGAQAKNVYWQVGSAATINAAGGGTMVGTIISSAATTFSTAGNVVPVTLEGRTMSLNAAVTLVNTHINVPAP